MSTHLPISQLYKAASMGNIEALYKLGMHKNIVLEKRYNWLLMAIEHGHFQARIELIIINVLTSF